MAPKMGTDFCNRVEVARYWVGRSGIDHISTLIGEDPSAIHEDCTIEGATDWLTHHTDVPRDMIADGSRPASTHGCGTPNDRPSQ